MARTWTDEQKRVIAQNNSNLLVSAAAGSGKTAVMVERIIQRILDEKHPVDIDRIVVVTFTKAAAAQMKERIDAALSSVMLSEKNEKRVVLIRRQLALLENAVICTIDSFCNYILRNYFNTIDLDPSYRIGDEGELKLLMSDVADEVIEEAYSCGDKAFLEFVDGQLPAKSDKRLSEWIISLYTFSQSHPYPEEWLLQCKKWYDITTEDEFENSDVVKFTKEHVKNLLKAAIDEYKDVIEQLADVGGIDKYVPVFRNDLSLFEAAYAADSYGSLREKLQIKFERLANAPKDADEELKERAKELRDRQKKIVGKLSDELLEWSVEDNIAMIESMAPSAKAFIDLVLAFEKRYSERKNEDNILSFSDVEHLALRVLRREDGFTPAACELQSLYEEIYIDEYQDSNMVQELILTAISRGNNIFMVGDIKQSIYSFRQADPGIFLEKYQTYEENNPQADNVLICLHNNFRSRANILYAVNDIFRDIMHAGLGGVEYDTDAMLVPGKVFQPFENHGAEPVTPEGSSVELLLCRIPKDDEEEQEEKEKREYEAEAVAGRIRELTGDKPQMIWDDSLNNGDGGCRAACYRDIVILLRSANSAGHVYAEVLNNAGIPAVCSTAYGYFGAPEIVEILNMLRVIDNPRQDIALAGVLRSYFCYLTAQELAALKNSSKDTDLYTAVIEYRSHEGEEGFDTELSVKIDKFLDFVDAYRKKASYMPIHELIKDLIYDTEYIVYAASKKNGKRRMANLDMLVNKAAEYENTSLHGLFNFLRYIDKLQKYEVDMGEADTMSENDDVVRIMSIHKSKGLEFPVVILTGMGKKINNKDAAGDVVIDRELGIGTNVVRVKERTKSQTIIKSAVSKKIIRDNISEEMRILYVAMTRAREKLFITGTVKDEGKAEETWHSKSIFLAEKGIFDYADDASCQNYFDMVMPQALMDESVNNGRFFVTFGKPQDFFDTSGASYMDDFVQTDDVTQTDAAVVADESIENDYDENPQEDFETQNQEIVELPEYPYENDTERKAKVTVSELKQMQHDSDFDEKSQMHESIAGITDTEEDDEPVPSFMSDEEAVLKGSRRGSAYHRIMECIDYGKLPDNEDEMIDAIKSEIADMLSDEKIDESQKQCVKVRDIAAFCTSQIGKRVKNASMAGKVWREQPFVFEMTDENDQAFGQLIQGVIDLYIVENDEITIVDYKTDRVLKGKKELRSRYSIQLDYYAKALSRLTGLNVKEKIIYSFTLGYAIDV